MIVIIIIVVIIIIIIVVIIIIIIIIINKYYLFISLITIIKYNGNRRIANVILPVVMQIYGPYTCSSIMPPS